MQAWMYLVLAALFLAGCAGAAWGYNRRRNPLLLALAILLGVPVILLVWFAAAG